VSGSGAEPIHVGRGRGISLRNPVATGGPLEIKARGEETGAALTVCESVTMPGEGPPFHSHASEDEAMFFVDGAFRLRIGDEVMDMGPGSFAFVPRDTPHSWQNVSEGEAHMLFAFTPASPGMERFFERFAQVTGEGSAVREAFRALAEDAGMTVLGPPLAQSHPLP
jgi:quercetin dioxygenase-like cupin family protein